jgi:WS/DGAT/MGAT family acyltransferase
MSRPLWEAYIIEGLDNIPNLPKACFAVYTKMHHSLVDGAGGSSFMAALHDLVPDPGEDDEPDAEPRLVDVEPATAELLTKASINTVKNTVSLARGTLKTALDLGKYAIDIARDEISAPDVSAPKTILNRAVGPHRVFDAAEFPLEGFKDIKNAAGVTSNDVALGVVGGALKRYLEAKGELPEEGSLAAGLPLNMRTRRGVTDENNQVGSVFASLHTDIEDPLERLKAIRQSTEEAKASGEASPMVDSLALAGVFSPAITKTVAGIWSRNELSRFIPLNISTVISNVVGPDFPLYCAGAKMVDYYGLGLLTPGMGIFHLVFSYSGKITLSVLADRDIIPDPEFYHDCLIASYENLYAEAVLEGDRLRARDAALAAKARIKSPRRRRAAGEAAAKSPAAAKSARKKTPGKKATTRKKAAATKKPAAKRKVPAKSGVSARTGAKAKGGTRKAPVNARAKASRPKAKRKAVAKARPKLRA